MSADGEVRVYIEVTGPDSLEPTHVVGPYTDQAEAERDAQRIREAAGDPEWEVAVYGMTTMPDVLEYFAELRQVDDVGSGT